MLKSAFFSLVFLCLAAFQARTFSADSLSRLIAQTTDEVLLADLYNKLSFEVLYSEPEKSYQYARQALGLGQKNKHKRFEAAAYNHIGLYFFNQSFYKRAIENFTAAQALFQEAGHLRGISVALNNAGLVHEAEGDYAQTLEKYQAALQIAKQLAGTDDISMCLNNIGNIYYMPAGSGLPAGYHQTY